MAKHVTRWLCDPLEEMLSLGRVRDKIVMFNLVEKRNIGLWPQTSDLVGIKQLLQEL